MHISLSKSGFKHFVHITMSTVVAISVHIKTYDSESRGQEEAGRMRDELKFVNALNKLP